jgi:hypothetical protein
MTKMAFDHLQISGFAFTDRKTPVQIGKLELSSSLLPPQTTMMNFCVAPNLPMSFGSHGDLPVLTKRTI